MELGNCYQHVNEQTSWNPQQGKLNSKHKEKKEQTEALNELAAQRDHILSETIEEALEREGKETHVREQMIPFFYNEKIDRTIRGPLDKIFSSEFNAIKDVQIKYFFKSRRDLDNLNLKESAHKAIQSTAPYICVAREKLGKIHGVVDDEVIFNRDLAIFSQKNRTLGNLPRILPLKIRLQYPSLNRLILFFRFQGEKYLF